MRPGFGTIIRPSDTRMMTMQRRTAGLVVFGLTLFGMAGVSGPATARPAVSQTSCQTISKTQVIGLFDQWNQALLTKRTEAVVARYAADATLLPTVQNGPLIGPDAIGPYFTHFLADRRRRSRRVSSRPDATSPTILASIRSRWMETSQGRASRSRRATLLYMRRCTASGLSCIIIPRPSP
jgi:ketosteroid isomerase-like protein